MILLNQVIPAGDSSFGVNGGEEDRRATVCIPSRQEAFGGNAARVLEFVFFGAF